MDFERKLLNSKRAFVALKCLQLVIQTLMEVICIIMVEELDTPLFICIAINGILIILNFVEICFIKIVFEYKDPTFKLELICSFVFLGSYCAFISLISYYMNTLFRPTIFDLDVKPQFLSDQILRNANFCISLIVFSVIIILSGFILAFIAYFIRHLERQVTRENLGNQVSCQTSPGLTHENELNTFFINDLQTKLIRLSNALGQQQSNQNNYLSVDSTSVTSPVNLEIDSFTENNFSDQVLLDAKNENPQNLNIDDENLNHSVENEKSGSSFGEVQGDKINLLPKSKAPSFNDNPAFDAVESKSNVEKDLSENTDNFFEEDRFFVDGLEDA